jgi:hypothetical protein
MEGGSMEMLKTQAASFKRALDEINNRMSELEKQS